MKIRAFNLHHLSFWYYKRLKGIFCFALREPDQALDYRVQPEFQGFYFSYYDRSPVQKEVSKCSYLRKEVWSSVYMRSWESELLGAAIISHYAFGQEALPLSFMQPTCNTSIPRVWWCFIVIYKMLRGRWRLSHPKIKPGVVCSEGAEEGMCVRAGRNLFIQVPVATARAQNELNCSTRDLPDSLTASLCDERKGKLCYHFADVQGFIHIINYMWALLPRIHPRIQPLGDSNTPFSCSWEYQCTETTS